MKIELADTTADDEVVLRRLFQLYAYDFSEMLGLDVGEDALFHANDPLAGCWAGKGRHAFLSRVDGRIAGFVILDERSRLTGDPEVMDVAELFVMRKYRRHGVGTICALSAFDRFPRKWEVRERRENVPAIAFWRRTIHRYTAGRFDETVYDDDRWRGPVQSFDAQVIDDGPHP